MTQRRHDGPTAVALAATVAAVVFAVAYRSGGYSLESRSTIAIAVWWAIVLGVALRLWPGRQINREAVVPGALLALFGLWSLASTAWAASAEDAFAELDRTMLYLGIYVLVVLAAGPRRLGSWIDGLAAAIAATGIVALASRLFPGAFPDRGLPELLPNARLSFPLDYWNGLGVFVALGAPLLLHVALRGDRARRIAAVAVAPALGAVLYLTSSRGAVVALAAGVVVFVVADRRRWAAIGVVLAALVGTAAAVAVLESYDLAGQLGSVATQNEWGAAVLVLLVCGATALLFEVAVALAHGLPAPGRTARVAATVAIVVVAAAAVAAAARSLRDFTELPATATSAGLDDGVGQHLLSGSGSGRWQFWSSALDEFRSSPLHGRGAGSFEAWWDEHASFAYSVKDAHSLYLESLAELGIVGFLLVVSALGAGLVVGIKRLVRSGGAERTAIAALLGAYAAYLVSTGVDWMWELTAVSVVGICLLGLLAGPATLPAAGPPAPPRRRGLLLAGVAAGAAAIAVAEAIPLLADAQVRESQAAVRDGDLGSARSHAIAATKLEPWASTPYLQLALVEERAGRLAGASGAIHESTRRDDRDWRAWLIAARIQSRLGDNAAAARSLARATALNPLSPLLRAQR